MTDIIALARRVVDCAPASGWSDPNAIEQLRSALASEARATGAAYRTEMGDAAQRYCESFGDFAPHFPGPWRWQALWEAMLATSAPVHKRPIAQPAGN